MKKTTDLLAVEKIDLSEAIAYASPMDTPFTTLLLQNGLTKDATSTEISWREAALDANRKGPQLEGADATASNKTVRELIKNNQQIFQRTAEVSGSTQAVKVPGVPGGEMAQEINDRMIEGKVDIEWYALQGTKADESGATPRQMNGLINLINSRNKFTPKDGKLSAEDLIKAFRLCWEKGAGGDKLVQCGAAVAEFLDKLFKVDKGVMIPALQGGGNIIGLTADVIHTRYGRGNIVLNRHMPDGALTIVDLNQVNLRPLRKMASERLAKGGDSDKHMIVGEYSLELKNSYAGAVISGISGIVEPTTPTVPQG
ncbi:SU10 major capsid protein [Bacillus wiedmannii]|uniref:SU10 major capsid protein n=1 Tax=Bacillus wiedmannii TaxID=1890302 RepID=UPI00103F6C12|nr:DUF5309 family protein [Bacillus wiedmannii]TCD28089.1 hypothetical protein E0D84_27970 [Bacillus wiedmannii]